MTQRSLSSRRLCAAFALLTACTGGATVSSVHTPSSPVPTSQAISGSPVPECPSLEGGSCLGPLSAGTYTTSVFQPKLTYRVPAGWGNLEDTPGNFLLIPPGGHLAGVNPGTSDYVGVYTRVAVPDPFCASPARGVKASPEGIAGWIADQPDLDPTTPRTVSVGGLDGLVLDVKLAKGSDGACLILGLAPSSLSHGLIRGLTIRLYLLRRAGTLAIEIDDVKGGGNNLDTYSSVVKNFRFGS